MRRMKAKLLRLSAAAAFGGTMLQLGGCPGPQSILSFFTNADTFNPCGTILVCDPLEYRFLTSGYEGPGVDPEIDPACTFPPFCAGDPFVGGLAGGP